MRKLGKRVLSLLLILTLSLSLSACNRQDNWNENEGKKRVLATTTMLVDLVKQLAGDNVHVTGLIGLGIDPHEFEPTARDMKRLKDADMVVYSGQHLEGKMTDIFEKLDEIGVNVVEGTGEIDKSDLMRWESDEAGAGPYDPHVWNSIMLWKQVTDNVSKNLQELLPEAKEEIIENTKNYQKQLDDLDKWIGQEVDKIDSDTKYLVTAHDAFGYLSRDYGFVVKAIQGISTETEATTRDIEDLAKFIYENDVKSIFLETSVPTRNAQALQEAVKNMGKDVEIGGELYSDSLGDEESGADTYTEMMRINIKTIVDALK